MFLIKGFVVVGGVLLLYSLLFLPFFPFRTSILYSVGWLVVPTALYVGGRYAFIGAAWVKRRLDRILDRFIELLSSMVL